MTDNRESIIANSPQFQFFSWMLILTISLFSGLYFVFGFYINSKCSLEFFIGYSLVTLFSFGLLWLANRDIEKLERTLDE